MGWKMTDLEKRADEYVSNKADKGNFDIEKFGRAYFSESSMKQALVNFAKAETALLSQHIIDLQKDKGNLTDRVRELEQQIEKMKCCVVSCCEDCERLPKLYKEFENGNKEM